MASRMEKYERENEQLPKSRSTKNQKIYEDFYTNTAYTEFTHGTPENAVDVDELKGNLKNRESYRKQREFQNVLSLDEHREEKRIEVVEEVSELKLYDINAVIEDAKKRREGRDELEKKRKLRNTEYNILEGLSADKIQEMKEKKKEVAHEEEPGLEELIHTITSKSLLSRDPEKENQDLLSDLMPESLDETIITEAISRDILVDYPKAQEELDDIDHSFYTRSMDLTDQDFEIEDTSFTEKKNQKTWLKVLCIIVILAIIIVVAYIVYLNLK